jgi:hypothetical protein
MILVAMKLPLMALVLALAGCAGGGEVEDPVVQESRIPVGLARYRTAFVQVDTQDPEHQEGVVSLRIALISRLTTLGCFDSFVPGVESRGADLEISALITGVSGVSETERVLYGGLAEKPRVMVEVRLVDLRTGALVGQFKVQGALTGSAASARMTQQAFENAGVGAAEYISKHK